MARLRMTIETWSYVVAKLGAMSKQIQRLIFSNFLGYQSLNTHTHTNNTRDINNNGQMMIADLTAKVKKGKGTVSR